MEDGNKKQDHFYLMPRFTMCGGLYTCHLYSFIVSHLSKGVTLPLSFI